MLENKFYKKFEIVKVNFIRIRWRIWNHLHVFTWFSSPLGWQTLCAQCEPLQGCRFPAPSLPACWQSWRTKWRALWCNIYAIVMPDHQNIFLWSRQSQNFILKENLNTAVNCRLFSNHFVYLESQRCKLQTSRNANGICCFVAL